MRNEIKVLKWDHRDNQEDTLTGIRYASDLTQTFLAEFLIISFLEYFTKIAGVKKIQTHIPYFIKYNVHMSIARTWISQWFLAKKLFLVFKNNFTRINPSKFYSSQKPSKTFLRYLPCIVCREYFIIIFNVKKVCTILDKIRYSKVNAMFSGMR